MLLTHPYLLVNWERVWYMTVELLSGKGWVNNVYDIVIDEVCVVI